MNNIQENIVNSVQGNPIDLPELARVLWKNILAIALVAVLAGSAAFGYTAFLIAPQYQATASLYANNSSFSLGSTNFSISSADLNVSSSLVSVYLYILDSRTTMEEVIKEANLDYTPEALSKIITSKGVSNTGAFEVTVTSDDPSEAELIANTIAKVLPDRISEIVDGTAVRIVDYAIIPSRRSGPDIVKNTAMGILAGGVLSAALVSLCFLVNDHSKDMIRSADDLRAMFPDRMILAMIPDMRASAKNGYYSYYYGESQKQNRGGKNGRNKGA